MDLRKIAARFAEGLKFVDSHTTTVTKPRKKTEPPYFPGVPSMYEDAVAKEVAEWWREKYPEDFQPTSAVELQMSYPTLDGGTCDLVFSSDGQWIPDPEWAIEIKRIQLVGNNGKNNDYGLAKVLSPYLKDRSLIHDLRRQSSHAFARHHACVGYVFDYDFGLLREARTHHPDKQSVLDNLQLVLHGNDRTKGVLSGRDLVFAADALVRQADLVIGDLVIEPFQDLWRHPCGGNGIVFAWEVKK